MGQISVSYTHLRAHETREDLVCRLLLENQDYICGDNFTAADCMTAHNINWAGAYGLCRTDVFKSYMARMKARPAFQMAFADAKEFEG